MSDMTIKELLAALKPPQQYDNSLHFPHCIDRRCTGCLPPLDFKPKKAETMTTNEMNHIVKRHFETGEYADTHFRMAKQTFDHLKNTANKPPPPPFLPKSDPLGLLFSLPISLDTTIPKNQWRLVNNKTREVIHEGTLDEE